MNLEQLIEAARKAIAAGNLDEAKKLTEQAKALKELDSLVPAAVSESPEFVAMKAKIADYDAKWLKLEGEPAHNKAPHLVVTGDAADRALEGNPFKSMGDFLMIVKGYSQGVMDQRLMPLRSGDPLDEGAFSLTKAIGRKAIGSLFDASQKAVKAPTGLNTQIDSQGGYLVGTDQNLSIMERIYNVGQILSRVDLMGISATSNSMTINVEDETSRATGSRRGGIQAYWMGEAGTYTGSKPKFRQLELKLKKVGALVYCTDEMLADSVALESYIQRNLPEELKFAVEDAVINGIGGGMPLGLVNSGALISVAAEAGQGSATVVAENIINMWARRWVPATDYVWLMNQDVTPQLSLMGLSFGVGGQLVYMPPGGLTASPYATLMGRPILETEYNQTLGTVGDIMLVSPSQYQGIDKGGIQSASSIHVAFTTGEQVFRFTYRFDGQPKWNSALTPKNGTKTVSPYVALATR